MTFNIAQKIPEIDLGSDEEEQKEQKEEEPAMVMRSSV
jgi:hypothetical protein